MINEFLYINESQKCFNHFQNHQEDFVTVRIIKKFTKSTMILFFF